MRCPRCGNENSDDNRFCGMCGAKLLPEPAAVASSPAAASSTPVAVASAPVQTSAMRSATLPPVGVSVPARPQSAASPRPSAPAAEDPVISGPSFLGLNSPPPRTRASLSADSHSGSSSSNLDYLLDDEEEHRRGGAGKYFLILLALALAAGFGYLRWKNQGFPSLALLLKKPVAAIQNSDSTDTNSTTPPASNSTSAPAAAQPTPGPPTTGPAATVQPTTPQPAASQPTASQPTTEPGAQPAANSSSPATPPPNATTPAPDAGNTSAATPTSPTAAKADSPAPDDSSNSPDSADASSAPAAKEATPAPPTRPAPKPKPRTAEAEPATKPHAGITPRSSADPVTEAQKYIYGRGATQDCERGLRLLKPLAAQANPKAMVEMGALYSAGLCTPHDLPTAYRWFAMALRKDPDNLAVQSDVQKLWGEMTQPERQLAIRMSH